MADPTTTPPTTPPVAAGPDKPIVLAPPAATTPAPSEVDTLKQQLAAAQKALDDRKAADAAAAQAKLVADGKLTEALAAKDAELAALKPHVDAWRAHEAAETARIAEAMKALPADKQAFITSQPTLAMKTQALAMLAGAPAATPAATPPSNPGGGPPAPGATVDVAKLLADGMHPDAIKAKHPEEYAKYANAFLPPVRLTSFAQQQVAAAAANGKKG